MEALGIDLGLLIAQLINYGLFFVLFWMFASKPFMKYVEKQKKQEREAQIITEGLAKQEEKAKADYEKTIAKAKKERDSIIADAKKEAEDAKSSILDTAKKEAASIVERAKKQAEAETADLEREMKNRAVDMSVMLVEKGLSDFLTDDARKKVTKSIMDTYRRAN